MKYSAACGVCMCLHRICVEIGRIVHRLISSACNDPRLPRENSAAFLHGSRSCCRPHYNRCHEGYDTAERAARRLKKGGFAMGVSCGKRSSCIGIRPPDQNIQPLTSIICAPIACCCARGEEAHGHAACVQCAWNRAVSEIWLLKSGFYRRYGRTASRERFGC